MSPAPTHTPDTPPPLAPLRITAIALEGLRAHATSAAPDECCGALLGHDDSVERYVPLRNVASTPRTAFAFDDAEWLRVAREADANGLEVLGIAHSHVDTPAEPSGADRGFGDAARWMLIVPVVSGTPETPRAWRQEGDTWREWVPANAAACVEESASSPATRSRRTGPPASAPASPRNDEARLRVSEDGPQVQPDARSVVSPSAGSPRCGAARGR